MKIPMNENNCIPLSFFDFDPLNDYPYRADGAVNIEFDLMGKYIKKIFKK